MRHLMITLSFSLLLAGCFEAGDKTDRSASDTGTIDTGTIEDSGRADSATSDIGVDASSGCESGASIQRACGTCGLGLRTCADGESGGGSCEEAAVPGMAGTLSDAECAEMIVYVDPSYADTGYGTKSSPFVTYADALQKAETTGARLIVIGGSQPLTETITVSDGISVLGGFSGYPEFEARPGRASAVEVPAPADDDVFGLRAADIVSNTLVARIAVTTAAAPESRNNYGAYLVDTTALSFEDVTVEAGLGGPGANGEDGEDGADGTPGEQGSKGEVEFEQEGADGGPGGTNSQCPVASGGDGGNGAHSNQVGDVIATAGSDAARAGGGAAGEDQNGNRLGKDGQDAPAAEDGDNGTAGAAGGAVIDDLWQTAGAGDSGTSGDDGSGGGGGGGAWYRPDPFSPGPGGGGGGAGGCGGAAGSGGGPGGGSFALFLVRSSPGLLNSDFIAGTGGNGGTGGRGGLGGAGQAGGRGTAQSEVFSPNSTYGDPVTLPYSSGDGGRGADGGSGGHGGGGAGGPSFGVLCSESSYNADASSFSTRGSASGGASPGNAGEPGVSQESYGCD